MLPVRVIRHGLNLEADHLSLGIGDAYDVVPEAVRDGRTRRSGSAVGIPQGDGIPMRVILEPPFTASSDMRLFQTYFFDPPLLIIAEPKQAPDPLNDAQDHVEETGGLLTHDLLGTTSHDIHDILRVAVHDAFRRELFDFVA